MFGKSSCASSAPAFGTSTAPASFAVPAFNAISSNAFNDFVQSQHNNVNVGNKFTGKCTSAIQTVPAESRDYFKAAISVMSVCKTGYSIVIETDKTIINDHLDNNTRKMLCTLPNLRIIRVRNILNATSSAFGFGVTPSYRDIDAYLICSKSYGFLPQFPNDSIQCSTYDMKYKSYTQLNLIGKLDIEKNNYSLDFTDYFMERVIAKPSEPTETTNIERQSEGVAKTHRTKTKTIPISKQFVFPTGFN